LLPRHRRGHQPIRRTAACRPRQPHQHRHRAGARPPPRPLIHRPGVSVHLRVMKNPDLSDARSRHRMIAVLAALLAVLVLTGIGVYGLITGPPTSTEPGSDDSNGPGPVVTVPSDPVPTTAPRLPVVRPSADPETFAGNIATALFSWDTASGFMPLDYTSVVLAVGDPSGAEQAGLAADIATYLPSREAWVELRQYATT